MKIYITFGSGHFHTVNGKTFDKDCVAVIECEDHSDGREKAFEYFGPQFCTSHVEETIVTIMKYFPRGQIEVG